MKKHYTSITMGTNPLKLKGLHLSATGSVTLACYGSDHSDITLATEVTSMKHVTEFIRYSLYRDINSAI